MQSRRAVLVATLALAILVAALPLAAVEPPPGFVSLFNGRDLSGWEVPAGDNGHWKVVGGDLLLIK